MLHLLPHSPFTQTTHSRTSLLLRSSHSSISHALLRRPTNQPPLCNMCQVPFHSAPLQQDRNLAGQPKDRPSMTEEQFGFLLLECAACNDLERFKHLVEQEGAKIDNCAEWYCREYGSNKMAMLARTPAMIAAMYGSFDVLDYILKKHENVVQKACGTDQSTVLHSAAASGADNVTEIVELLLRNGADPDMVDANGFRPFDVTLKLSKRVSSITREIFHGLSSPASSWMPPTCILPDDISVNSFSEASVSTEEDDSWGSPQHYSGSSSPQFGDFGGKNQGNGLSLSEIRNGNYATDEFRMYSFKVRPCSKAYTHDWTECPFAHPGENAKRRDPRKHQYSCVPCPDFRKGDCKNGDSCEYAHGVFETWLHPSQYRTRMCKDAAKCSRRVCFFAHSEEQLRPVPDCMLMEASSSLSPIASPSIDALPYLRSPSSPLPPHPFAAAPSTKSMDLLPVSPTTVPLNGAALTESQRNQFKAFFYNGGRDKLGTGLETMETLDCQSVLASLASMNLGTGAACRAAAKNELNLSPSPCLDDFPNGQSPKSPLQMYFNVGQESSFALPKSPLHHQKLQVQAQLHQLHQEAQHRRVTNMMARSQSNFMLHQSATQPSSMDLASTIQKRSPFTDPDPYSPYGSKATQFPHLCSPPLHPTNKRCQSSKNLEGALAWSDWGSPTGKPDWGVIGDDLTKFRKSMSFKDKPLSSPCIQQF